MKWIAAVVLLLCSITAGQDGEVYGEPPSRLQGMIERFEQDYGAFNRFYTAYTSPHRIARMRELFKEYLSTLEKHNFESLEHHEQVDYVLFRNYLDHEMKELGRYEEQLAEMGELISFARTISDLEDARRRLETIDPAATAAALDNLARQIGEMPKSLGTARRPKRTVSLRTSRTVQQLRSTLRNWYNFHAGYDPKFTWWNEQPYKKADEALDNYNMFVLDKLVGIRPDDKVTIIGDPIGREALLEELKFEMIPYSPEELVAIANREFEWCIAELKKASREMGFGDDYMKAIEAVKQKYVEPGMQPALIRDQAREAIDYVKKHDLVSVPRAAEESWRMEMMSPERQMVAPFFLGGETILVAYPTNSMAHEQKLMSLRGNNPHFARAVTHHELIPGHHLQQFMNRRYRTYRGLFRTPFWTEGWALYWEFILWDRGFVKTPEDKIGALFWRSHRAARILFSLNFHLGNWTPEQCVDLLVNKVGHERENALAEVRRSFSGDYGPLYQMAYMMGGLQFYTLHRELVGGKKMSNRQFHDTILREGAIPVEMVRSILTRHKLNKDHTANWKYYVLD